MFLTRPEGAFYFVARLPIADSDDFARWLLADFAHEKATVMVAPARGFYATPGLGANEVRIAYVLNEDDLKASIRILGKALETYPGVRDLEAATAAAGVAAGTSGPNSFRRSERHELGFARPRRRPPYTHRPSGGSL